jgi:hypothetical protein
MSLLTASDVTPLAEGLCYAQPGRAALLLLTAVCVQLFWFLSYFPEPLSISAQSLVARDMAAEPQVRLSPQLLNGHFPVRDDGSFTNANCRLDDGAKTSAMHRS